MSPCNNDKIIVFVKLAHTARSLALMGRFITTKFTKKGEAIVTCAMSELNKKNILDTMYMNCRLFPMLQKFTSS